MNKSGNENNVFHLLKQCNNVLATLDNPHLT